MGRSYPADVIGLRALLSFVLLAGLPAWAAPGDQLLGGDMLVLRDAPGRARKRALALDRLVLTRDAGFRPSGVEPAATVP